MVKARRNSVLSFTQRSRVSSSGSIPKIDTTETARDKEIYHMKTKADPTQALNEAQPGEFPTTNSTQCSAKLWQRLAMLLSLRPSSQSAILNTAMQRVTSLVRCRHPLHAQVVANTCTADPDRSNPTRPRMERPLDTIRSFEAAIDGSYSRRASFRAGRTHTYTEKFRWENANGNFCYRNPESHGCSEQPAKWLLPR